MKINCRKLILGLKAKITRKLILKILDWVLVLTLGSMSYFFVVEAWNNYKSGRTNMSLDRIPIQKQPAMMICFGEKGFRIPLGILNPEFYYYKIKAGEGYDAGLNRSLALKEGENHFEDEIIILQAKRDCFSLVSRPKGNYVHHTQEERSLKIILPNENDYIGYYDRLFGNIAYTRSLEIAFVSEENLFALQFELDNVLTQSDSDFRVKLPKRYDFEVMALVEIQPKLTSYIEEKGACRNEPMPTLIAHNFTGPLIEFCGTDACIPKANFQLIL